MVLNMDTYIEPTGTNDWFSGMLFFEVASKNDDHDKAKLNMHLKVLFSETR